MPATAPLPPADWPPLRPGLPALRLDPHQRRPVPLCPPPRVPILARLVRRLLRRQVDAPRTRTSSSSTTTPRQCPPPCQAGGPRRPRCRPQGQARRPRQRGLSEAAQVQHRGRPVFGSWAPASATCTPRPSARADFPSALVAGVDSAGIAPTSPPSPTPSAPVYSGGPPALTAEPPSALGRSDPPSSPSLVVTGEVAAPAPDTAPGHDVDAPLSAVASARVRGTVEPLRPSDYPEFPVMGSDLMPGSSQAASAAFNLAAFARAYTPDPVTADPPTVTQRLSLAAKVDQLFEMFTELRRELQSRAEDVPP
ncbi:hypothetical protein PF006_g23101, partial [Phytophthora fragariae]